LVNIDNYSQAIFNAHLALTVIAV